MRATRYPDPRIAGRQSNDVAISVDAKARHSSIGISKIRSYRVDSQDIPIGEARCRDDLGNTCGPKAPPLHYDPVISQDSRQ